MNFMLGTLIIQLIGFLFFIGSIVLVIVAVIALVKIRANTEQTNRRLEAIERLLAESINKRE
ncbi:hypothetical protein CIG75_05945 [Tumebacillus algifaecis]|uniref:DUF4083 domain-containing protein n=1 Tax=Tumebacillus algifaecis TaxID=1214604 RepID=A0A223CYT2_9BACL|nr:hypothetical protein [Tumebacillus algifaecis]ASS74579.1 hypothetical protein CIG75_05945 [Tumebacillus algifaecis]